MKKLLKKLSINLFFFLLLSSLSTKICSAAEISREELDRKYWPVEIQAQEHEETFVVLWDEMRQQQDKWEALKKFPFNTFVMPTERKERQLELDILAAEYPVPSATEKTYNREEFNAALDRLIEEGYRIEQLEFHHSEFRMPEPGQAISVLSFVFHVINHKTSIKYDFTGQIEVTWNPEKDLAGLYVPDQIKIIKLKSNQRDSRIPAFTKFKRIQGLYDIGNNPLLLYDFDHKGYADIVLPSLNLILRNNNGRFTEEKLFESQLNSIAGAIIGEFTGDNFPDLVITRLYTNPRMHPQMHKGKAGGKFEPIPVIIELTQDSEMNEGGFDAVTAGDIDGDGDLDLFLGSYTIPYDQDRPLPTPYYDANDGEPAFLLQNDGRGNFKDITVEAGLGPKRFRLSYSASFVDLDEDWDLDLVVVSDFSGIDVYRNDGKGHFEDITDKAIDNRSSFGMAHTFGDFNLDGHMDIYVIGMGSTTARRLTKMGITIQEDEFKKLQEMVMAMGYGNRMYYGTDEPGIFKSAPNNDQVARTGWGWGTSNFDLDNDGDPEIYVANGHISKDTARDYCTFFWRQDIYMNKAQMATGPMNEFLRTGGSWNGFEHNVLFLNKDGEEFINTSYVFGTAFEFDSRDVVTEDFNLDGRTDLMLSDIIGNIYIMENNFKTDNHWIGISLRDEGSNSAIGAKVIVSTDKGEKHHQFVNGDSFISQHAYKKVFGLGKSELVNYVQVQWPNGKIQRLDGPKADRYYLISSEGIKERKGSR